MVMAKRTPLVFKHIEYMLGLIYVGSNRVKQEYSFADRQLWSVWKMMILSEFLCRLGHAKDNEVSEDNGTVWIWTQRLNFYSASKVIYIRLAIVACPDGKRSQYTSGFGKWLVERKVKRKFSTAEFHTWLLWVECITALVAKLLMRLTLTQVGLVQILALPNFLFTFLSTNHLPKPEVYWLRLPSGQVTMANLIYITLI